MLARSNSCSWNGKYSDYEVIMARITEGILPDEQTLSVTLDRWQELMRICPSAFNGLERTDGVECCDCDAIWRQSDRDALAIAIGQAEEMREQELGYHLSPKYIDDEEYSYKNPIILRRKHLVAIGSKKCDTVALSVPIVLSVAGVINDPVTAVVPTTVTDSSEIHIFYPGEDVEIRPQSVVISGGNATITIIRARLISWAAANSNCDPAPRYDDDANFITTIDVKRCYTDLSDGAFLVWEGQCCSSCDFTELTQQLYPTITNPRLAIFTWKVGTYSAGVWTPVCCFSHACCPNAIRVSYLSGRKSSVATEIQTIRLAHTLLPNIIPDRINLCSGCWKEDRVMSESMITPYGNMAGAIMAWSADSRAKIGYGGKTPRSR